MRRTYVLDTCVLLADPHAPLKFDEHDVVIPLVVVEELDQMKTRFDEVGANARRAIRLLEEHGASRSGGLRSPVMLDSGGTVRIGPDPAPSPACPSPARPPNPPNQSMAERPSPAATRVSAEVTPPTAEARGGIARPATRTTPTTSTDMPVHLEATSASIRAPSRLHWRSS